MRGRRAETGFTLVELMIAIVAASILVALAIGAAAQVASTSQSQRDVADAMQTLRAASDLVAGDSRDAGYLVASIDVASTISAMGSLRAVQVSDAFDPTATDSTASADRLLVAGADDSVNAAIATGTNWTASSSVVSSESGLGPGMVIIAVNRGPCNGQMNAGCVLQLDPGPGYYNPASGHINHNPGLGAPWNQAGNSQCQSLGSGASPCWASGTVLYLFAMRAYRIAPPLIYPQGMLQMSPTGGAVNDWVDLAPGFVDLQVALCIDQNGDGLCEPMEWVNSGPTLANPPPSTILAARVTLVTRTFGKTAGWTQGQEPSEEDHNLKSFLGTPNSAYIYRALTQVVELRNGPL